MPNFEIAAAWFDRDGFALSVDGYDIVHVYPAEDGKTARVVVYDQRPEPEAPAWEGSIKLDAPTDDEDSNDQDPDDRTA